MELSNPVEEMDGDRLKALLSQEISSSLTHDKTELAERRARNLEYLQGVMADTPAAPGRSSVLPFWLRSLPSMAASEKTP